jgi:protein O-GlcNAc transferase
MAKSAAATFQLALSALRAGKPSDAEKLFRKVLSKEPRHVISLNLLGNLLLQRGKFEEAEVYLRRALHEDSRSDVTLYNYGIVLRALNQLMSALECFSKALTINPDIAESWNIRGEVFRSLNRYEEAVADFDKAIALNPGFAQAHLNKVGTLAQRKLYDQSLVAINHLLSIMPTLAEAWLARGDVLYGLGQGESALVAYDQALELAPRLPEAWIGRGNILCDFKKYTQALAAFNRALAIDPDLALTWYSRAIALSDLNRYQEALADLGKALSLKPDLARAWRERGNTYMRLLDYDKALADYEKAIALEPDLELALGTRFHLKQLLCDWSDFNAERRNLLAAINDDRLVIDPFDFLSVSSSPADQLRYATLFAEKQSKFPPLWHGDVYLHERIRVAYLSGDFYDHAVMHLMAGLFENHDKSRFEVSAISFGPDDNSPIRRRVIGAIEKFINVKTKSNQEIAELIRQKNIDILVDLQGYTHRARYNVLARRPAPIQVNYLGYPGTMGAKCIDYILADRIVIPPEHFDYYKERVVWMPESYLVNDSRRPISAQVPSRSECGLPGDGFVFCCFNNSYKITPDIFNIWMRVLRKVEKSVLWLREDNATASLNLRQEAEKRGVAANRLVFAARMSQAADHLGRHQHADLFLDTLPYNAHTTASDALWTGVPVLTSLGTTFAGRVAASLLTAIGMEELITYSLEDYEALALEIARDSFRFSELKSRLAYNRNNYPLFNTQRFTRHIENAYITMWEQYKNRGAPTAFVVKPIN